MATTERRIAHDILYRFALFQLSHHPLQLRLLRCVETCHSATDDVGQRQPKAFFQHHADYGLGLPLVVVGE